MSSNSAAPLEASHNSLLSRKFGPEPRNYFGGNPLNRVSFLRGDHAFLSSALTHASTRFVLLKGLGPLTRKGKEIITVGWEDVKGVFLGDKGEGKVPFEGTEEDVIKEYDSGVWTPQLVFLGLGRAESSSNSTFTFKEKYNGAPWFALDVSPPPDYAVQGEVNGVVAQRVEDLAKKYEEQDGLEFVANRMNLGLKNDDASIYASARHVLDWNARNPYCAQCGYRTLSTNAGWKRTCPPSDVSKLPSPTAASSQPAPEGQTQQTAGQRPPCATRKGVSNLSFPRTDPVIIVAVASSTGSHLLLGRQARFPPGMYSTLAGFLEPGESLEDAVRREVWEEAGVHLSRVVLHSTQPWPYPANIMMGAIATAVAGAEDRTDLENDPELEDARWWPIADVRKALENVGEWDKGIGASDPQDDAAKKVELRVPPETAIANVLLDSIVKGGFLGEGPRI